MKSLFSGLTAISLRFRAVTLALVILLSIAGVYAVTQLKQELIPSVEFPQTIILAQATGMNSEQVLTVLTSRIETALDGVEEIVNLESSTTGAFGAVITARNNFGTNQERLRDEIQAAINAVWLPLRQITPPEGENGADFAAQLLADLSPEVLIYLQQGDSNVAGVFSCAAKVGTAGHSSERPMDALVAALAPAINATGGCNQGFLRDDAFLVVTFISDDTNYEDQGTPESWYQAVLAAKKGDPNAVAMVGFTPVGCGGGGKAGGKHWEEFVKKFPFNLHAQVCSADYVETFTQAVKLVDESCDNYVPPVK